MSGELEIVPNESERDRCARIVLEMWPTVSCCDTDGNKYRQSTWTKRRDEILKAILEPIDAPEEAR